jgi:predicted molibdopterin-dependent oxidoreductase YjgC
MNLRLVGAFILSKDMELTYKLCVATEKIDTKIRKNPPSVTVTFCPFCGEKQ